MQGYAVLVQDFGHYVEAVKSHSRKLSCRSYDKICIFEDLSVVLENGLERVGGGPEISVVIQG